MPISEGRSQTSTFQTIEGIQKEIEVLGKLIEDLASRLAPICTPVTKTTGEDKRDVAHERNPSSQLVTALENIKDRIIQRSMILKSINATLEI